MTYRLVFSDETLALLRKLDNQVADRILRKLAGTVENPARFFERLVGRDEYKARVGDHRILARIDHKESLIFILSLGHRKSIYKKI